MTQNHCHFERSREAPAPKIVGAGCMAPAIPHRPQTIVWRYLLSVSLPWNRTTRSLDSARDDDPGDRHHLPAGKTAEDQPSTNNGNASINPRGFPISSRRPSIRTPRKPSRPSTEAMASVSWTSPFRVGTAFSRAAKIAGVNTYRAAKAWGGRSFPSVSYTHLTLPTKRIV